MNEKGYFAHFFFSKDVDNFGPFVCRVTQELVVLLDT